MAAKQLANKYLQSASRHNPLPVGVPAVVTNFVRKPALLLAACVSLLAGIGNARGAEFHDALSLQGFTGLLNTPNARVTEPGTFYALYSNQEDVQWRERAPRQENYLFSVGFFSFAEVGGRLTDTPEVQVRDLSANIKIRIPFIPKGYHLPDVAFGMQDLGGGLKFLQTKYIVATEEIWRSRLSIGYGSGPDRMEGVFGGIELKALDWLYFIGEYDTRDTNVGARVVTPELFGYPVKVQFTAKSTLNHRSDNIEVGFGLQFPLGLDRHRPSDAPRGKVETAKGRSVRAGNPLFSQGIKPPVIGPAAPTKPNADAIRAAMDSLQSSLVTDGFQNVRVGRSGKGMLVVEYENARYNWNELDGIGVVLGTVLQMEHREFKTVRLIIRKKGIRIIEVNAPLQDVAEFFADPGKYEQLNRKLGITTDVANEDGIVYLSEPANTSGLTSSVTVYPGLKNYVGTEVGVFDYLLSAKVDYFLNSWKGAVINARLDVPLSWSENFDEGEAFDAERTDTRVDRAMLFQAFRLTPKIMVSLGGGMVLHDRYGTLNEAVWEPGDGKHRFLINQGYVKSPSDSAAPDTKLLLGSYRYYHGATDTYVTGTVGKFFDNDKGGSVELKRFFGDTAVSLFYKSSWTTDEEHVQAAGIQFAFPLTPRRDMKPRLLQVKGSDEWSYAQETKVVGTGNNNSVSSSNGVNPHPSYSLDRVFYNRDRLSETYIREHLLRIRDAYLKYVRK